MGLAPGEKAKMYALGGLARGGATRGGYTSTNAFISIGGEHVGSSRTDPAKHVLMASLTIVDNLEQTPNTCSFTTRGFAPALGATIIITLGTKNSVKRLFGGVVLKATQIYLADNPKNVAFQVDAIDFTWLLNRRTVVANYVGWFATDIALDLMTRFTSGFTTVHVQPGLSWLDLITFTNVAVTDALSQLVKRIGGYYYIDYGGSTGAQFGDLHLYVGQEPNVLVPTTLTVAHPSLRNFVRARDLSQMVTRAWYEGGGANAAAIGVPGETILAVDTVAWYNSAGGIVACGPQRVTYQTYFVGGGGTFIGPGASPSAGPIATIQTGAGVTPGSHDYAVTFVTASGESVIGPRTTVVVAGALAPSPTPLVATQLTGGNGPEAGGHYYATSFVTAAGETVPGPSQWFGAINIASGTTLITVTTSASNVGYSEFHPGDVIVLSYTYSANPDTANWPTSGLNMTSFSPGSAPYTIQAGASNFGRGFNYVIPFSPDPNVQTIHVWISVNGAARTLLVTQNIGLTNAPTQSTYYTYYQSGQLSSHPAPTTFNPLVGSVALSNIPIGPAGVTQRKVWRTKANTSAPLYLLATLSDNTTTTYTDASPDASLGAGAPVVATAQAAQVLLTAIPLGAAAVTGRRLYRSAANSTALKLLTGLGDNTTTGYLDTLADGSLGAAAPSGDTSGLTQPAGQVLAGSSTMLVAGAAAFRTTGGWALISGGQIVRYHGISGNVLTGIPPTGVGAITASVPYNSTVIAAPALEGIPASGAGAIVTTINLGDPVNLLVQIDDTAAQAQLAALIGGDGIQEAYQQDNRISETEARARAHAYLTYTNHVDESITYDSRDTATQSGTSIQVILDAPTNIQGTYKIQQVTIAQFDLAPAPPLFTAAASSHQFSFEDLLRLARTVTPPGA